MDQLNTNSKVAALEAAWQNGTAEAHCATLRHMATRVIQHDNVRGYNELRVALAEALLAKNTQARCKGYSPLQWVLGYEESLPGSVLERPQDLAAHSMALDEEGPGLGSGFPPPAADARNGQESLDRDGQQRLYSSGIDQDNGRIFAESYRGRDPGSSIGRGSSQLLERPNEGRSGKRG